MVEKMLVWNLVDFKKVNLAFDCEGVPMLLQRPHITERVELLSPITFPLKSEYERMNGTIEGVNSSLTGMETQRSEIGMRMMMPKGMVKMMISQSCSMRMILMTTMTEVVHPMAGDRQVTGVTKTLSMSCIVRFISIMGQPEMASFITMMMANG